MTRQEFFEYCQEAYGISPDYPFEEDFETAVFRHTSNRKWFALAMHISKSRLGIKSDETADVVNMKLPTELLGSFDETDGVYPAYHMNKKHWISVLLDSAGTDTIKFLLSLSFEATKTKVPRRKNEI